MRIGWNLKEALTTKPNQCLKVKDHKGNEFNCERDMCKYYNIPANCYYSRKRDGWTLEKALTTPSRDSSCQGVFKETHKSLRAMTDYYCTPYNSFKHRESLGWSLGECLGVEGRGLESCIKNKHVINTTLRNIRKAYTGRDGKAYYKCEDAETLQPLLLNADEILLYKQKDYKTAVQQLLARRSTVKTSE